MPATFDPQTGTLTFTVGEDDTDAGVHLKIAGEAESRVHITPQGEIKTGDGTTPPTAATATPEGYDVVLDDPLAPTTGHVAIGEIQTLEGVAPDFYTAVGHATHVSNTGTAVGTGAGAKAPGSTAVGYSAVVDTAATGGTALGNGAHVPTTCTESTAVGHNAVSHGDHEVTLGAAGTHATVDEGIAFYAGISEGVDEPGNPDGHQGILFVRVTTGGKRQLCTRLGSGNGTSDPIIVIATEA